MKPFYFIALVLVAFLFSVSAHASNAGVIIIKNDGTQTEISLNRLARIDIGKDGIKTHLADGTSEETAYSALSKILVGAETTSVSELLEKGSVAVYPTVTTGKVTIAGLGKGDAATAYSTSGNIAAKATAPESGIATLDLSGAQPGVYIIATAGTTVKIIKK